MKLDFLYAANGSPIGKTIEYMEGAYRITPYPHVKHLNSVAVETDGSLQALHAAILEHGTKGAALMKGRLNKPLENESKAGNFDPAATTHFALLDLDFSDGFDSIDQFLETLDPSLKNVSYIFQHSASAGATNPIGLRGHIFFLLDAPASPSRIKQWLIAKNLDTPQLHERIELAANGLSLKFPLDTATNNNHVPIFIAPPTFIGCDDPLGDQRTVLVEKTQARARIDWSASAATIAQTTKTLVDQLRAAKGLRKKSARYAEKYNTEILVNPDPATVEIAYRDRGFTYLNLNGGDSQAYYFPDDNPKVVYNFKGEPNVYLKDIAPELYRQLNEARRGPPPPERASGIQPLGFHDRLSDRYYTGFYDPNTPSVELFPVSSSEKLKGFLTQFGVDPPETIPNWVVEFDPSTNKLIDTKARWCNSFRPSIHMQTDYPVTHEIPPAVHRVLKSVCVDQETLDYYINWLAYAYVTRNKTGTAWIFSGTQGTGKGLMFHNILRPLFGEEQVSPILTANLEEKFNSYADGKLIVFCDEFHMDNSPNGTKLIDRIKNLITESFVNIRLMGTNPTPRRSFVNLILATNHRENLPIPANDRRFNVAPRQEIPLQVDSAFVEQLDSEIAAFAAYLQHVEIDVDKVRKPLQNEARALSINAATNTLDGYFEALRDGDLDYFLQFDDGPSRQVNGAPDMRYDDFVKVLDKWKAGVSQEIKVSRLDLERVFSYIQNQSIASSKFTRMAKIRQLKLEPLFIDGVTQRGCLITFHSNEIEPQETPDNVRPLRDERPETLRADLPPSDDGRSTLQSAE